MSPALAWSLLIIAAALEAAWATALKRAGGFEYPGWALLGYALAALSLYLLSLSLRVLPVGAAYAAWVGLGAVGVAVTGAVFGEALTLRKLGCLGLIIVGVVGLQTSPARP